MKKIGDFGSLYSDRKLGEGVPELGKMAHEIFVDRHIDVPEAELKRIDTHIGYLSRLMDLPDGANFLILGCGPVPALLVRHRELGYNAVGVEPISSFVESAREYAGSEDAVLQGLAEEIPLADGTQDVVFFQGVMEHVDSPPQSIAEIYRVLKPGGAAIIHTTNRHALSILWRNPEYNVKFYSWFPALVKECYVHQHLHYAPDLANGTERPAVHWFSYTDLCRIGRDAGFAKFYHWLDLVREDDPSIAKSALRRLLVRWSQHRPWLRALVLSQLGGTIIMHKRPQL